jgi:thiamine-phosphate pyrophosphorylase
VRDAVRIARASGSETRILVNDRLDAAIAAGAEGVHLGADSVSASEIVRWCRSGNAPSDFLIGVSCHRIEEAQDAETCGVNYVFFGPVFDTPSKRSFGEPQGVARLAEVCRTIRIPVIAIGGVNEENAGECVRAGAAGIAAIRLFQNAKDLPVLQEFIAGLRRAAG